MLNTWPVIMYALIQVVQVKLVLLVMSPLCDHKSR